MRRLISAIRIRLLKTRQAAADQHVADLEKMLSDLVTARDTVDAEAAVSRQMTKYAGLPVVEQANAYLASGLLPGLWASGFHTRDITRPGVIEFFERWWYENVLWTYQDQLSLPWARQRIGVEITDLPHGLYNNPWFRIGAHTRED